MKLTRTIANYDRRVFYSIVSFVFQNTRSKENFCFRGAKKGIPFDLILLTYSLYSNEFDFRTIILIES